MKSSSVQFIAATLVAVLLGALFHIIWNSRVPAHLYLSSGLLLLGLFALFGSSFHLFLLYSTKGSAQAFVRKYMVTAVLKFLLYILLLVAFLYTYKAQRQAIILHFLVYYVLFTVVDVTMLYRAMNNKKRLPRNKTASV